jgi:hypothetical protein
MFGHLSLILGEAENIEIIIIIISYRLGLGGLFHFTIKEENVLK